MRIAGITIPDQKRLEIALTAIYGVGRSRAHAILDDVGIDYGKKAVDLSEQEETRIREKVESFTIEGDLKRRTGSNIKRLKDINSYRGTRHAKHLPARGQTTRTNSRTVRGNVRKTMMSGRRKLEKT